MLRGCIAFALCMVAGHLYALTLHHRDSTAITVHDDTGRLVSIRLPARRIVTLAPSNTMIVTALGMTATIVGASSTDDDPLPAAVKRVGSVNPSIEDIVSLRPSLVMGIYGEEGLCDRLERLRISCMILSPHDIRGVMHDIELVGRVLSAGTAASAVVKGMEKRLHWVSSKLKHCRTRPLVYFEIDASDPSRPFSAGRGSFIDSLIVMSHAVNIAHDVRTMWPQLSSEYILARDPDVIILSDGLPVRALRKRPGWSRIKAVRNGRVYSIRNDLVSRPGPEIVDAFIRIAEDIHPEVFDR